MLYSFFCAALAELHISFPFGSAECLIIRNIEAEE